MLFDVIKSFKNNTIQYIGDIEYIQKEFDPCGYKTITITEEYNADDRKSLDEKIEKQDQLVDDQKVSKDNAKLNKDKINKAYENKKRLPLVIFDEDAPCIDETQRYFDITTGENKKSLKITLGGLTNKGVYCKGLC